MHIVNTHQAKTELSQLIGRALAGDEVIIARAGRPVVKLQPIEESSIQKPGVLAGKIQIGADFDQTPAELAEGFYDSATEPTA